MFDQRQTNLFAWVAAALLLVAVGYRVLASKAAPAPPPVKLAEAGRDRPAARLYVHVAGAVRRPGLYKVRSGARVAVALELAGGPRPKADLTTVNLAAKVEDGQQVVVPAAGPATAPAAAAAPAPGTAVPGAPISLATATQAQLEELDGIGPALAQAILEYRDANGGFRSIEELQEVDGIGEKRFEALRESVTP